MMGLWSSVPASFQMIAKGIRVQAQFMYERDDRFPGERLVSERKVFFLGVKKFSLADWRAALDAAAEHRGIGKFVVINL